MDCIQSTILVASVYFIEILVGISNSIQILIWNMYGNKILETISYSVWNSWNDLVSDGKPWNDLTFNPKFS